MNTRLQDKIDQYHSGRMDSNEFDSFEKELASDPSLQAESDFQLDIINGLKEFRKTELKTRLNAVDIAPNWFEFVQQSTLLKSFGGVAVATLVGTGVYFMAIPDDAGIEKQIVIDAPEEVVNQFSWSIKPAILAKASESEDIQIHSASVMNSKKGISESTDNETVALVELNGKEENLSLDFDAPTADEVKDEEALEISNLEVLPKSSTAEEVDPIDVNHELTSSLNIKYKYYDGKLFLSGDFDRAPYEILEINSANGRRIYVKYLDKYYKVGVTDKLTTLPEVSDKSVIQELELLRKNK